MRRRNLWRFDRFAALTFENEIRKQMALVFERHTPHPNGTRVAILAPLDVVNVITNPLLLAQITDLQGIGKTSCGSLRQPPTRSWVLSDFTRNQLQQMCSSVLKTQLGEESRKSKIFEVQTAFAEVWKKLASEWNAGQAPVGYHFDFIQSVRQIQFQTGDLGNDCFHPGIGAHQKIADEVLKFLGR